MKALAQFSLVVTQTDAGKENPVEATCSHDACRATLAAKFGGDVCILNIRVGAPSHRGTGTVEIANGPCRSGRAIFTPESAKQSFYTVDDFGAFTETIQLPVGSKPWADDRSDLVLRTGISLRIDVIANGKS
jgi:hypothetical protein